MFFCWGVQKNEKKKISIEIYFLIFLALHRWMLGAGEPKS
jgi:hypothetical protein